MGREDSTEVPAKDEGILVDLGVMNRRASRTRLSIIIPALNEVAYLPSLLAALAAQTSPAREIIVADAGSTDGTIRIAREAGCSVVAGGAPAVGRNAGAKTATGDILMFLDADVVPDPDLLEQAMAEFERSGCVVATCLLEPLEPGALNSLLTEAANVYLQVTRPIAPHAPGCCILALRAVHERIGGFDESLALAEDHDYVQRAARHGRFCVLSEITVRISMRRIENEGIFALGLKYAWCEMHALAGRPIREIPFDYEFGAHGTPERATALGDEAGWLREQLRELDELVDRVSDAARERLDEFARLERLTDALERLPELLEKPDLGVIRQYLARRIKLLTHEESRRR